MADDELRESERAWRAAPDDHEAVGRHVAALRRAGLVVSEALLDARVQPARTFRSDAGAWISVVLPDGIERSLGHTRAVGGVLAIPEHRSFVVVTRDERSSSELRQLAGECYEQDVERVRLGPTRTSWTWRRSLGYAGSRSAGRRR